MPTIHQSALVDSRAILADDVHVGPYVIIEGRVEIGAGTVIHSHSVIHGATIIGARCKIGPAAYVGLDPQHLGYKGEETWLVIGDETVVRETSTIHRATHPGREHATRVGSRCLLMGGTHVAHDAQIADEVIMANAVLIAGHCRIGHKAFMGGGCAIHQFVRIGRLAIVSGNESVSQDIPPFAAFRYGGLKGYNAIGCKRSGMSRSGIHALRSAFLCFQRHRTAKAALDAMRTTVDDTPEVREILAFAAASKRGLPSSVRFGKNTGATVLEVD